MIEIAEKKVVINGSVLLRKSESTVKFSGENGLTVVVVFDADGTGRPSIAPSFSKGVFRLPLSNFGSALGMAVAGSMTAQLSSGTPRPGLWALSYALSVHLIGEDFRNLHLTITEERVA